jgi:hypothetical protein
LHLTIKETWWIDHHHDGQAKQKAPNYQGNMVDRSPRHDGKAKPKHPTIKETWWIDHQHDGQAKQKAPNDQGNMMGKPSIALAPVTGAHHDHCLRFRKKNTRT